MMLVLTLVLVGCGTCNPEDLALYSAVVSNIIEEWTTVSQEASRENDPDFAEVIADLEGVLDDVQTIHVPGCARENHQELETAVEWSIKNYEAQAAGEPQEVAQEAFINSSEAHIRFVNGLVSLMEE